MKRFLILLLVIPILSFGGFFEILQDQLLKDSSFLSATMKYKEAEFKLSSSNSTIPYVSTSITGSTDFGNYSISIPSSVKFQNILGFDFNITDTLSYSSETKTLNNSGLGVTISRTLFSDYDVTELQNQKNYLSAAWNLVDTKNKIFVNLANDIFNYYYYTKKLEITRSKLDILEKQFIALQKAYESGTVSENEILQVQSSIYQATNELNEISQNLIGTLTDYSTDALNTLNTYLEKMTDDLPSEEEAEKMILNRPDLKAQQIALEIAKRQSDRAYQEWLLNPQISFSVKQDNTSKIGFSFSLNFSFSYNIFDHGEKNYAYNTAKESYTLQQSIFNEQVDSLKKDVQKAFLSIKISESSKKVAELNLQLKKMEYEKDLKAASYISQTDLESARLNFEDAEISLEKANYDLLMAKIKLITICGFDLVQIAGGK